MRIKTKLIIIRGNSGSGKTTIAKKLRQQLTGQSLLVSQDTIRREILAVADQPNNLAIKLISQIASYGNGRVDYVIVEGILAKKRYEEMLLALIESFDKQALVYYFDLPFAETVRRHQTKEKVQEYGRDKLREWWLAEDFLGVPEEKRLGSEQSSQEIVTKICDDVSRYNR